MKSEQLEFLEIDPIVKLKHESEESKKMIGRVVRNQYGKIANHEGRLSEIEQKLSFLEHMLCNPDKPFDMVHG